jgi:hypothetical protein
VRLDADVATDAARGGYCRQTQRHQASNELAAWIIKHAAEDELPMVLTWLRSMKNKTVISAVKSHMEGDRHGKKSQASHS